MASFSLTNEPIAVGSTLAQAAAGGYVVFEGRVRDRNEGRDVRSLEYEAFGELALKTGEEILREAEARFSVLDANCVHRTGHLQIGDIAIRVEVASAHRKAAFEACDWIVDEVKKRVPIWKKEHYVNGDSGWINANSNGLTEAPSAAEFYARQTILKEVGAAGQAKLGASKLLIVGAGGLGSPALLYLAAAGVGTLGVAEFDGLDISNLHRQILYSSDDVGKPKSALAANRITELNPRVTVQQHTLRLGAGNVAEVLAGYDLVLDCTDNFRTKFLLNDACVAAGKPLIQASIYRYEGQLLVIEPGSPCLRCLWPQVPEEGCVGSCADVGVLGFVPGVFGTLQAAEAIKLLLGMASPLREGKMLLFDLLSYEQRLVSLARDRQCPACGAGSMEEVGFVVEAFRAEDGFCLVDIREEDEVLAEPIRGAIPLPMSSFEARALPAADRYLLVCESGVRSDELARQLWAKGDRRFYSLAGGLRAAGDLRK